MNKLAKTAYYPELFKKAFGTDSITSTELMFALSQFMTMLVSDNSRYDQYVRGNSSALTSTEIEGMNIFI